MEVKLNPKIYMETQKMDSRQSNCKQKETAGGVTIPNFKLCHRAIVTKPACYWDKNWAD